MYSQVAQDKQAFLTSNAVSSMFFAFFFCFGHCKDISPDMDAQ